MYFFTKNSAFIGTILVSMLLSFGILSCTDNKNEIVPETHSILAIDPSEGPPGINVGIFGKSFENSIDGNQVLFGDTEGVIVSANDSLIVAKLPDNYNTEGQIVSVPVKVRAGGKTVEGPIFTITHAPQITVINPKEGPIGISVTINGGYFGTIGSTVVKFNGIKADIKSISDNKIITVVPAGATSGNITVSIHGFEPDAGVIIEGPVFTIAPPYKILNVNPKEGSIGTFVTITGENFGPINSLIESTIVKFNGIEADLKSASANEIITVVPAGATSGNIIVSIYGLELDAGDFNVTELKLTYDTEVTVSTISEIEKLSSIYNSNDDRIYLSTAWQILQLTPEYNTTVIAGIKGDYSYTDGPTSIATFHNPIEIIEDSNGDLLISDIHNKAIRKILNNEVSTYYSNSDFFVLFGITIDKMDNIFISDFTPRIWKLTPQLDLTIFVEFPALSGSVSRLAIDADENIFALGDNQIFKVSQSGMVETIAGSKDPGIIDGIGSEARFNNPLGIAIGADGYVYISDSDNYLIRRISPEGNVTTVCGLGVQGFINGDVNTAKFMRPSSIAFDETGDLLVVDNEQYLRKIHLK